MLDGKRLPTSLERVHALLRDVPLGFHLHLMERDSEGNPLNSSIVQAESDADRLAYQLLAPAEHVLSAIPASSQALIQRLQDSYGLPRIQAMHYAGVLLPSVDADPLLLRLRSHV